MRCLIKISAMLQIEDLHFSYGPKKVLSGLSLSVKKGEIVSLIGISGSGKTTLFRLIAGHLVPEAGKITGIDSITYMQQEDLLLPWRDTLSNLTLLNELGKERGKFTEDPFALLAKVGLKGCERMYPHELSGGMRSRLSLARSLLQGRPLLLLDEPFGSLDVIIREGLYDLVATSCKNENKGVLLVTHDFRDALSLSDRILVLSEGKISAEFQVKEHEPDGLMREIRERLKK
jgi:NitT/TauT family transport system ATP-binding protein